MDLIVKRTMDASDVAAVSTLLDVASDHDGHRALGEHQWLDLVQGGRGLFAGLVAEEPGHDHPVAYAQVTRGVGDASWALEYVVDPHHRHELGAIATRLLDEALGIVATDGGGHVHLWVSKPTAVHDAVAAKAGMTRGRDLLQLRRSLPAGDDGDLLTRPFVPGSDEETWLSVNNRAFEWHPEQGEWDLDTLRRREGEPWFEPDGFLLHEREGRLAGFCWTKVHADHDPPLGEIYVIAVDPDFKGVGLGRDLVLAGLASLHGRGLGTAMLYVDADNTAAVGLYEKLGFTLDHIDRAYTVDVAPR